jgi:hypothetical protein
MYSEIYLNLNLADEQEPVKKENEITMCMTRKCVKMNPDLSPSCRIIVGKEANSGKS